MKQHISKILGNDSKVIFVIIDVQIKWEYKTENKLFKISFFPQLQRGQPYQKLFTLWCTII